MRILVDENIPAMTARALREAGHDVADVRGTPGEGMTDHALWQLAQSGQRLLITTDKGFASRRKEPHHGLLVVRLRQPNRFKIHERVLRAVARFDAEDWRGQLVVMRDATMSAWRSP